MNFEKKKKELIIRRQVLLTHKQIIMTDKLAKKHEISWCELIRQMVDKCCQ